MGGFGSGRPSGSGRETVEASRSIDVNRLHREGCLRPGWMGGWQWTHDGEGVASVNLRVEADRLYLSYRMRIGGADWEDVAETVQIVRVPCPFGGSRPYFICPGVVNGIACGRRVAKLHAPGRYFLCRQRRQPTKHLRSRTRGCWRASTPQNETGASGVIKYVSDKSADYDGFEPPIVIPKGASFKDMVALKGDPDIGNKINTQVIQPLIDANTRLARSDFPDFNDPNKLGDGQAVVERLGNLIAIFEDPALDFSQNRADHDDILGDAYEYLMRHFATQSGKSKGQFYTPAEVSRVIAKVIGISPENTVASTTAYDPTCGSGSLLLKVASEAGKHITLEGQEKDSTTAGLARMNMILHDFPTANIASGGEGMLVKPRFLDGKQLRTYDFVVANPPFSDKTWSTGLTLGESGEGDRHKRFT